MRQQTNKTENGRANPETINWDPQIYNYAERTGNLKAEAVGVVSGEKHFPVFEGRMVFKPLTKSKPLSTPLFAYAEVFWSWVIDAYFIPAPQYQLALCRGYEAECGKYYDYGTVSPMIYEEGEHLLNLLEFFRAYPDDKVQIDDYLNYCQMFYDYTEILEADYFQKNSGNDHMEYDMLISNPPYIRTEDIEGLMEEVRFHDPVLALDGKENGLYFYEKITEQAGTYLKSGGWLMYEIGCDQGMDVSEIMKKNGFEQIEIKKDLAGLDRVVTGRKMQEEQNV